jgi:hypothetical protein
MQPARKFEAALCVLCEFFRRLKTCFNSGKRCYRATETEKAFAVRANAFPIQLASVPDTQGRFKSEPYGLLTTTCGAGLLTSSWALTF